MNNNDGNTTPPPSHGGVRRPNTITPPPPNVNETNQPNPVTPPPQRPGTEGRSSSTTITPPRRAPPITPPPTTPVANRSPGPSGSGGKRPLTPGSKSESPKNKSAICPICHKNMWHEKALNGHIRWHTQEERDAANRAAQAAPLPQENVPAIREVPAPAGDVAAAENMEESGSSPKRVKILPDLNQSPPQDEE